jgi:hypothetical protein
MIPARFLFFSSLPRTTASEVTVWRNHVIHLKSVEKIKKRQRKRDKKTLKAEENPNQSQNEGENL